MVKIKILIILLSFHCVAFSQRLVATDENRSYILHNDSLLIENLNLGRLKCNTYQFVNKENGGVELKDNNDLVYYVERIYQENDNKDYYYILREEAYKTNNSIVLNKNTKWDFLVVLEFGSSCISVFRLK